MTRFVRRSSRRLVAVLALATTTALPALVVIAGQSPADAKVKDDDASAQVMTGLTATTAPPATMAPDSTKWH